MNGGESAVRALFGESHRITDDDMHTVNLLESGMTRAALKLGMVPTLKVDPPMGKENDQQRRRAMKRHHIVTAYDKLTELHMDLPQAARWLLGYGYAVWVHTMTELDGEWYPTMELRDSFDCWPGYFGPKQQPVEIGFVRYVDESWLDAFYPESAEARRQIRNASKRSQLHLPGSAVIGGGGYDASWEGKGGQVALVEYWDAEGMHMVAPAYGVVLAHVPNPIPDRMPFTFVKRYSFDALKGQYDNAVGMMAMMAKLNVLALIASEDAVFRETNVIGDLIGSQYKRGRFAVNYFQQGTQVVRPTADVPYQLFQQIDRVERQIRIDTQYSVMDDGQSPNSFVTGQGLDRLSAAGDLNVTEHQTVIAHGLVKADAYRLAWDEAFTIPGRSKPLPTDDSDGTYRPSSDIGGRYHTQRLYGIMAGWDEPQKIVTGLQLLQAGALDLETFQENLSGLEDVNLIRERNRRDGAEQQLVGALAMRAQQGDPQAMAILVEIYRRPDQMDELLAEFFAPQQEEMVDPLAALMAEMGGGGGGMPGEVPPPVTTVLSQLDAGGGVDGGIQTVGRL